jgi:hypothetical protein
MRNAFSYIQWKIAMARMQEANMAASEITEQGSLTQPAARKIAEYHLDRYFEMVEAELNYRRKLVCDLPAVSAIGISHLATSFPTCSFPINGSLVHLHVHLNGRRLECRSTKNSCDGRLRSAAVA